MNKTHSLHKPAIAETDYKISVKTSDLRGAGTDANVYVILFGVNGDSGELHLKDSETSKSPFQNGQVDVFTVKGILSLGELSKLRVWHDNKGGSRRRSGFSGTVRSGTASSVLNVKGDRREEVEHHL